jgi:Zn-dependent peptidase ImmA (M78 family)
LPVIVFGNEAPAAQAFTLAHEFAHILLQQSAISGPLPRAGGDVNTRKVEEWCNSFAGAFLLPAAAVEHFLARPAAPWDEFPDDQLHELAQRFGISEHAALIRLIHLRYVRAEYYWNVKKPAFDQEDESYTPFGRAKYYGRRYTGSLGNLYTTLVMEALASDRITNHNAAEFLGIKNLAHLRNIRAEFGV